MIRGGRVVVFVIRHGIASGDDPPGRYRVHDDVVDGIGIAGIEGEREGLTRVGQYQVRSRVRA